MAMVKAQSLIPFLSRTITACSRSIVPTSLTRNGWQLFGTLPYQMASQYFNSGCVAMPTVRGQNGNRIWPYIKGPALFNTDLSLYKMIHFTSRQTRQFCKKGMVHTIPFFFLRVRKYREPQGAF
jgi:hypothetical protein